MSNVAKNVIEKLGGGDFAKGVPIVAEILGIHTTRVYRMTYSKERGGTGGFIKAEYQPVLLKRAPEYGICLEPADFFEIDQAA